MRYGGCLHAVWVCGCVLCLMDHLIFSRAHVAVPPAPAPPAPVPQVYPEAGTVSFSAGLHGWAFTLTVFAKLYAKKFGVEEKKMMERLWGDNFFDPATKKWTNKVRRRRRRRRRLC